MSHCIQRKTRCILYNKNVFSVALSYAFYAYNEIGIYPSFWREKRDKGGRRKKVQLKRTYLQL